MQHDLKLMAEAWLQAASDLGIRVEHPFTFTTVDGEQVTTVGVYLPDFGSPAGALIISSFDDSVDHAATRTSYFQSFLSDGFDEYDREVFIDALNDWGWFGKGPAPAWFQGGIGQHGGSPTPSA